MTSPEGLLNDDAVEDLLNEAGEVDDAKVADALGVSQDDDEFRTLKYSLLGPSLTKAGQDSVDQTKVRLGLPPIQICILTDWPGIGDHLQCF